MVRIISALILAVTAVCASAAEPLKLVDNPPDRHVVVRGDTLWGISGKFLKEPWRWPEIWNMNREEIKNPHLIYPGQVVYLDRSGKTPRLRIGKPLKSGTGGTVNGSEATIAACMVSNTFATAATSAAAPNAPSGVRRKPGSDRLAILGRDPRLRLGKNMARQIMCRQSKR